MDSARNHSISAALLLALALTVPPVVAHADAPTGAAPATSGSTHTGHDSAAPTTPSASAAPPASSGTPAGRARADEEEESDGRDADLLWVEAIAGYSYVNMRAIAYDNLYPSVVALSGSGYGGGLAAGVRLSFVSIGARATLASYEGFEVGTAAAEITLRLPTPVVEPWVRAGFGYGWHGNANYDEPSLSQTNVYGYVIQAAAGLDIYLGRFFAIGAGFDVDVLNLSRQALTLGPGMASPTGVDLTKDGNAVGLQLRGHVAASLHF
jgi:hypothetical protein